MIKQSLAYGILVVSEWLGDVIVEKKMRHWWILGIIVIATLAGLSIGGQAASAKVKYYKTVPTALRGSWYTTFWKADGYPKSWETFTKYTWKHSGQTISMKAKNKNMRLGIYKTKAGYYRIGYAHGDMPEHLKPVTHNGKKALRGFTFDYGNTGKIIYIYYYKK